MRSEFEKHYLSLEFYTEGSAQLCLDACTFDEKQDAYLPNIDWILENDEDECVVYCCMLNTAYISFKHQQSKVDELQLKLSEDSRILHNVIEIERKKNDELQNLVDVALEKLDALREVEFWQEDMLVGLYDELEQALKGGEANG